MCLKESENGVLQGTERSMVGQLCGVQLRGSGTAKDLMLHLNETVNCLAVMDSVCQYGRVLKRLGGHVLRRG